MATNNSVNTSLSGQTGSGSFVGSNAPTLSQPILIGRTSGSTIPSNQVGATLFEIVDSGSPISLTTDIPAAMVFMALDAGYWAVSGCIGFLLGASTVLTNISISLNNSISLNDATFGGTTILNLTFPVGQNQIINPGIAYVNVTGAPLTIYLVAQATFTTSTVSVYGQMQAQRIA